MMLTTFKNIFSFSNQFIKLTRMQGNLSTVAKLELSNPKKKNALSIALLDEVKNKIFSLILLSKKLINSMISEQ